MKNSKKKINWLMSLDKLKKEKNDGNLLCEHANGREHNFNKFTLLEQFYYDILRVKLR